MWDLALLQVVPNIAIAAPRDAVSLREQLREAVSIDDGPTVVRFPKGNAIEEIPSLERTADGADILARSASKDVLIVAVGAMVPVAMEVHKLLAAQGIGATVLDPRWVIPVKQSIVDASRDHRLVVTIEDGIRVGGVGTRIRQQMRSNDIETGLQEIGLPDEFLEHATRDEIMERVGLTPKSIARDITAQVLGAKVPKARPLEDGSEQISDKREYET
jgi:1-deoxy-D-xylulose-5-phosphate synthase